MKKIFTLLLVLTGMLSTTSAWTYTAVLKGSFDSWGAGVAFSNINDNEMVVKLDGNKIHSGDMNFKMYINSSYWRGPYGGNYTFTTPDGSSEYDTNFTGGEDSFILKKNTNAKAIYIYIKYLKNVGSDTQFKVIPLVAEDNYDITYYNTWDWNGVNAHVYYNDIPLNGTWPGGEMTGTTPNYSLQIAARSGAKIIFSETTDSGHKTSGFDLVNKGHYNYSGLQSITVSISSAGYATFSSEKSVDFTDKGVNAYIASISGDKKVVLTKHNKVPAYNGVLLKGDEGTYDIPITDSPDAISTNKLMASVTETAVAASTAGTYHYVLANSSGIGFYNVATATTSGAGKAYLETDVELASEASARVAWVFDEESTGIENVKQSVNTNNEFFNLAGQRVAQPTKGLYIVNGKKVIIK